MNKLYTLLAAVILTSSAFAQSPEKMSYQAVVRDAGNALITDQAVGMQISILQGSASGTAVYVETQTPNTNINGLVSIEIGSGTVVNGAFNTIDWSSGLYFIKTETDPTGGTNYTITGTSQLMSVPYALYAKTSGSSTPGPQGPIGLTGLQGIQGIQGLKGDTGVAGIQGATGLLTNGAAAGNTPYWDGSQWVVNNSNIHNNSGGIGINTSTPDASAQLDIVSTTKGFLPPRMTTVQRNSISSPAAGLVIYNTTSNCLNFYAGSTWHETCGTIPPSIGNYPPGSVFCALGAAAVVDVTNPTTGKTWMDRNLGASQVATSSTDNLAYGDLYQWGRASDGHQCRISPTTASYSNTDQPGIGNFILAPNTIGDWRSPQNTNLWQGVNGVNNPCPISYRIPTESELNTETLSWSSNTSSAAFFSPLKLTLPGQRVRTSGSIFSVTSLGRYWSSTVSSTGSRILNIAGPNQTQMRANGFAVRCIKN